MSRRWLLVAALASTLLAAGRADARSFRPRFEPTDLELEDPGVLEIDLQLGPTTGDGAGRLFAPDYEVDIGLTSNVEIDIDGAYALEPWPRGGSRVFVGEPVWTSAKIGVVGLHDEGAANAASFGVQLGPLLPVGETLRGAGYEAIALAGGQIGRLHLALNLGGLIDPAAAPSRRRPYGLVGGVDIIFELDDEKRWRLTGEIGSAVYFAESPSHVATTIGVAFAANPRLDVSLAALAGPIGPSDRVGALLGVAQRIPFL